MQLWLLMNATEKLGAQVIRKLAVITRQAERIHLSQPARQRSSSSRLADDNASKARLIVTFWAVQLSHWQQDERLKFRPESETCKYTNSFVAQINTKTKKKKK